MKQNRNETEFDPSEFFEQPGLLGEEGVPGAILAIKGNPSLDKISEIGLGIKNPYNPSDFNSSWASEFRC